MRISLIVAMAENRVIGRDGGLPWHIPGDLAFFKEQTLGKPIVMGRKTWGAIGRPLPGRPNIVITRDRDFRAEGAHVTHSLDQALDIAQGLIGSDDGEVMIIGGAEIYRQALALADCIYLTEVHLNPEGDALLDDFEAADWRETWRRDVPAQGETPAYDVSILERISPILGKS